MNPPKTDNKRSLIFAILLMCASALSCTLVQNLGGERVSEKTRQFNESLPAGIRNAERDAGINDPKALKIILPEPGQILLGNPDGEPLDADSLGKNLKEAWNGRSENDPPAVYLAAASNIPASNLSAILDDLRINNFDNLRLLVSSPMESEDKGFLPKETPSPDRVLEVALQREMAKAEKPNPLTLVVQTDDLRKLTLNKETQEDLGSLSIKLRDIFREREMNGVFREGTNEVYKSVWVPLPSSASNQNYGDLVKLIDAIKESGADPIVLGDKGSSGTVPEISELDSLRVPETSGEPKIISGGVLNGKAKSLPVPPYPPAARAARASGSVNVQVMVDVDGKVISASAVSGHPLLRAAAVSAARMAIFTPTLLAGKPVKVTGLIVYNFVP